ncbi:unnamed protein product [Toxocara canis]|uniref:DDE_Tnp_IS1595 domain-containing protein n=1 Tax=Toxocara canis TaxID=6265 RepID=A0A183UF70_TOXCA|nr:unnamed protein product [Toxocara canis]
MNPLRIGGEGAKVKVEQLRITQEPPESGGREHWGYCGIQVGNEAMCFIEEIEDVGGQNCSSLKLSSLLMVIDRYIRPGTEVVSSVWKRYEMNGKLPDEVKYFAKERSLRLVETDEEDNRVAVLWSQFKALNYKSLDKSELICTHIKEFMWRQMFAGKDCMYHLWSHIAAMYPLT